MTNEKKAALDTLKKVKEIYENDASGLLVGGFYHDFMREVNEQIREIEETVN